MLIGAVELLIIYSIYWFRRKRMKEGEETTGQVVDVVSGRGSKGGTVSYPVFQFRTYLNKIVTVQSKISSRPSLYKTGDEVMVIYNPEKPERFVIRGDKRYRLVFFILGGIALAFFIIGVIGLVPVLKTVF